MPRLKMNNREKEFKKTCLDPCKKMPVKMRHQFVLMLTGQVAQYSDKTRQAVIICESIVDNALLFTRADRKKAQEFLDFYDMTTDGKEDEEIMGKLGLTDPTKSN